MRMRLAKAAALLGALGLAAVPLAGHAQLSQVASRAALDGNLSVPWTAFGPVGAELSVYQQESIGPETVGINSSSGSLYVSQQGNGFTGDFLPGTVVLTQPNADDGEVISFATGVAGFGVDIDPIGFTGSYTAYMAAYDSVGNLIGVISVNGVATGTGAGTAPFLGATSFSDLITHVNFGLVEPGNPDVSQLSLDGIPVLGNIALDDPSLLLVPEPASFGLVAGGALMLAMARRGRHPAP
jgi:hypothetical protein